MTSDPSSRRAHPFGGKSQARTGMSSVTLVFIFLGFVVIFTLCLFLFAVFSLFLLVIWAWNIHYNGGTETDATHGRQTLAGWLAWTHLSGILFQNAFIVQR